VLMGLAGWYLYSKWSLNNAKLDGLKGQYARLKELAAQKPNPGEEGGVDNVAAAKAQQAELHDFSGKVTTNFQHMARVPDLPKVTDQAFSKALSLNIDQMLREASNASVTLPSQFSFSFQAERNRMTFDPNGLNPLAIQLGEVKAITGVLFAAKVNSLDGLRRERSSPDDATGPESDYLDQKSVTNLLSVMSPYELTFRCFSPELASVLSGFASSPYGLVVKTINVEHAPAVTEEIAANQPAVPPQQAYVQLPQPTQQQLQREAEIRRAQRYASPGGDPYSRRPPPPMQPQFVAPAPAPVKTGLQTVLDEKQLRVTVMLEVVKLLTTPKAK
jgi:hypothetical protein